MIKNAITRFEIFTDQNDVCLTGRLLGLIKEETLFPLLNNRALQRKTLSKKTLSISEVTEAIENRDEGVDVRLVAVVKEISDKPVSQKVLFISDKLDFVSGSKASGEASVNAKNDSYIFMEEIENNEGA